MVLFTIFVAWLAVGTLFGIGLGYVISRNEGVNR